MTVNGHNRPAPAPAGTADFDGFILAFAVEGRLCIYRHAPVALADDPACESCGRWSKDHPGLRFYRTIPLHAQTGVNGSEPDLSFCQDCTAVIYRGRMADDAPQTGDPADVWMYDPDPAAYRPRPRGR